MFRKTDEKTPLTNILTSSNTSTQIATTLNAAEKEKREHRKKKIKATSCIASNMAGAGTNLAIQTFSHSLDPYCCVMGFFAEAMCVLTGYGATLAYLNKEEKDAKEKEQQQTTSSSPTNITMMK